MANYLVFISHKRSSQKYLYFKPNAESALKAQLEAWNEFKRTHTVLSASDLFTNPMPKDDDWLLRSVELSIDAGLQFVEVL